ncbi:MAG: HslU--HslV peptidase ATPase subunit [Campylobacterales bacterium]|nr:HslU--HslV peptidase ATPase subunit [Campylobacterales bacterium]
MNMTPKEIVAYLDQYVIGQREAKKTIALALRTRYRRMQLDPDLRDEVMPKNILMIGSTGVGKTELSRRLAKMMRVPFIKVEASKYTEVGFVGRDVESMIRDLMMTSMSIVKEEFSENAKESMYEFVLERIVEKLLPPLPSLATDTKKVQYEESKARMRQRVMGGEMDNHTIEIELPSARIEFNDTNMMPEMAKVQESFSALFANLNKGERKKEMKVSEAKEVLLVEAEQRLLDMEAVKKEALRRTEQGGIIFLDEIDKIAVSSRSDGRNDPSKEGVQRDLLPIVEGSSVNTKFGTINTDHILFIAAGAFHLSRPSDLIPELQGRFPLRVELEPLDEEALYKILRQTKNSLLHQYQALLAVEGLTLEFDDEAVRAIARIAHKANEKNEDIGARRLHTVLEKLLEDISFSADEQHGTTIVITAETVHKKLNIVIENDDLARYIL